MQPPCSSSGTWRSSRPILFPVAVLADQEPTILPGPLHEVLADPVRRDRTLGALHRYALVRRDGDSIQMHRLVQAAVRRTLPPPERATVEGTVLRLLQAALPVDILDQPNAWPRWRQLLPHVLVASAERPDPVEPSATCLLYTSDAADEEDSVDLGGRRSIKKKKERKK